MTWLVTTYVRTAGLKGDVFGIVPFEAFTAESDSPDAVKKALLGTLLEFKYVYCASIMQKESEDGTVFNAAMMITNPHYDEEEFRRRYSVQMTKTEEEITIN